MMEGSPEKFDVAPAPAEDLHSLWKVAGGVAAKVGMLYELGSYLMTRETGEGSEGKNGLSTDFKYDINLPFE